MQASLPSDVVSHFVKFAAAQRSDRDAGQSFRQALDGRVWVSKMLRFTVRDEFVCTIHLDHATLERLELPAVELALCHTVYNLKTEARMRGCGWWWPTDENTYQRWH